MYNNIKKGHKSFFGKEQVYNQSVHNFGFEDIHILEGNIGYLKISYWADPNYIDTDVINNVTGTLIHSQALIIDLRETTLGSIDIIPLFCSYFLSSKSAIDLGKQVNRFDGKIKELKTFHKLKGKPDRFDQKAIYILTSNNTGGISEFATYILKKYRNATIIGERTAGSAFTMQGFKIIHPTYIQLPNQQIIPNEGESWHKKGILPDIEVSNNNALDTAWVHIFKNQIKEERIEQKKTQMTQFLEYYLANKNNLLSNNETQPYQVQYEYNKEIFWENGFLYLMDFKEKIKLLPIDDGVFLAENINSAQQKKAKSETSLFLPIQIVKIRFEKNDETNQYDIILIYSNKNFTKIKKL